MTAYGSAAYEDVDDKPIDPNRPVSDVQKGHHLPFLDQNAIWNAGLWVLENLLDDPRTDQGRTFYGVQSFAKSIIAQNHVALTADAGPGATTLSVNTVHNMSVGMTVGVLLDDGSMHFTVLTGISGLDLTIADTMPSLASAGARKASVTKSTTVASTVSAGTTIPVANPQIAQAGDVVRIERDDGSVCLRTVASVTANAIEIDAAWTGADASPGRYVYIGPHDVDPNFTIYRLGSAPIKGDILGQIVFGGPRSGDVQKVSVQYGQIYARILEPDAAKGLRGEIVIGTVDGGGGAPTPKFRIGRGLSAYQLGDPGNGKANFAGLRLNNYQEFDYLATKAVTLDFPSVSPGASEVIDVTIPGARPGLHVAWTNNPFAGGSASHLIFQCTVVSDDMVRVRALNFNGVSIDPGSAEFRIVVLGVPA